MKTPEEIRVLAITCSEVLDSSVQVEQDEFGMLTFIYPASKHGHRIRAVSVGNLLGPAFGDGQELWQFHIEDLETKPVGTLEPLMICGLLHF